MMYVFLFKQMTSYDMRISDWSSDLCPSDLPCEFLEPRSLLLQAERFDETHDRDDEEPLNARLDLDFERQHGMRAVELVLLLVVVQRLRPIADIFLRLVDPVALRIMADDYDGPDCVIIAGMEIGRAHV